MEKDPAVKFAAVASSVGGIILALVAIWSQPIPDYIKSLGTSLLMVFLLWVYLSLFYVKKSECKEINK